jgi:hypothetical protein
MLLGLLARQQSTKAFIYAQSLSGPLPGVRLARGMSEKAFCEAHLVVNEGPRNQLRVVQAGEKSSFRLRRDLARIKLEAELHEESPEATRTAKFRPSGCPIADSSASSRWQ